MSAHARDQRRAVAGVEQPAKRFLSAQRAVAGAGLDEEVGELVDVVLAVGGIGFVVVIFRRVGLEDLSEAVRHRELAKPVALALLPLSHAASGSSSPSRCWTWRSTMVDQAATRAAKVLRSVGPTRSK